MANKRRNKMAKTKKITAYECPECGELHEHQYDAEECCPRDVNEMKAYQCIECGYIYEDKEDAEECCEWKMKKDDAIKEAIKIVLQHKQMTDAFYRNSKLNSLDGTIEVIEQVANDLIHLKIKWKQINMKEK